MLFEKSETDPCPRCGLLTVVRFGGGLLYRSVLRPLGPNKRMGLKPSACLCGWWVRCEACDSHEYGPGEHGWADLIAARGWACTTATERGTRDYPSLAGIPPDPPPPSVLEDSNYLTCAQCRNSALGSRGGIEETNCWRCGGRDLRPTEDEGLVRP